MAFCLDHPVAIHWTFDTCFAEFQSVAEIKVAADWALYCLVLSWCQQLTAVLPAHL